MNTPPASDEPVRRRPARLPPLVVTPMIALLMWAVARATPSLNVALPARRVVAIVLLLAAGAIGIAGVLEFRRARTTVNPLRPDQASSLVTGGIYRHTRNPMYVALAIALLGWAVYLGNVPALLGIVVFVAWMNRCQIVPEERALAALFGDAFERYRRTVRRWL